MKVKVQYYGMISERMKKDSEEMNLDVKGDSLNLKAFMESKYPELKRMTYQIAVDQELKETIDSHDEVKEIALLPPFAGG